MNNRVELQIKGDSLYACWDVVRIGYEMDRAAGNPDFGYRLNKITEKCIYPENMKKMKVIYAARICSATVSKFITYLHSNKSKLAIN